MKKAVLLFLLSMLGVSGAFASGDVLKVSKEVVFDSGKPMDLLKIVARDDVLIKNVVANRGNCKTLARDTKEWEELRKTKGQLLSIIEMQQIFLNVKLMETLPIKLKYGQSTTFSVGGCKDLLELQFETDKGTFTYDF